MPGRQDPDYALRLMPESLASEAAVLASMMIDKTCIVDVSAILRTNDFYHAEHQIIFEAILELERESLEVNGLTVGQRIIDRGKIAEVGGTAYLRRVIETVPGSSAWRSYAATVKEKSVRRRIIADSGKILNAAYGTETLEDVLATAQEGLGTIVESEQSQDEPKTMFESLQAAFDRIDADPKYVMESGPVLSSVVPGFEPGQMIVICGRPGHGKTAFALHLAIEGLRRSDNPRALFYSYEMTYEDMAKRMIAYESWLDYRGLNKRNMTPEKYELVVQTIQALYASHDIRFDGGDPSPYRVSAVSRKIHRQSPISAVFVDYIQRMYCPGKFGTRNDEVSKTSNILKNLALELEIPVFVLSQLNRQVDHREDHHPRMSDLRDSGTIEQDADIIIGAMRPWKYDPNKPAYQIDIDVLKHRNGAEGRIEAMFDGPAMRIYRQAEIDTTDGFLTEQ